MSFKMPIVTYMQMILNCTIVLKGASDPDSLIKNLEREVSNVSHCLSINKMTINTKNLDNETVRHLDTALERKGKKRKTAG